jgi:hypothetical protein
MGRLLEGAIFALVAWCESDSRFRLNNAKPAAAAIGVNAERLGSMIDADRIRQQSKRITEHNRGGDMPI